MLGPLPHQSPKLTLQRGWGVEAPPSLASGSGGDRGCPDPLFACVCVGARLLDPLGCGSVRARARAVKAAEILDCPGWRRRERRWGLRRPRLPTRLNGVRGGGAAAGGRFCVDCTSLSPGQGIPPSRALYSSPSSPLPLNTHCGGI